MVFTDVRPTLIRACPELLKPFEQSDADDHADLPYLQMGAIARYLGERLRRRETGCFASLFEAVEGCIIRGDEVTRNLVIVGLLEDLQNSGVTGVTDLSRWRPYLGPTTTRAWDALERLWNGDANAWQALSEDLPPAVDETDL